MMVSDLMKARFWAKVDVRGPDECWPWLGTKTSKGYGKCKIDGAWALAHRVSLSMKLDHTFKDGELSCHHCDNPICVNPAHLFLGSHQDNMRDCGIKDRFHKWGGVRRGEGNPRAKIGPADIPKIRAMRAQGMTFDAIASEFGISKTSAFDAVTGKTWKHAS